MSSPITVPALRDRKEDIPALVRTFVQGFVRTAGKVIDEIPQAVMDELTQYNWPGNVRELENVIERAVVTTSGRQLRLVSRLANTASAADSSVPYQGTLDEVERDYIERVLGLSNWRIEGNAGAAELLGLHPNTLRFRMRKLGITRPAK